MGDQLKTYRAEVSVQLGTLWQLNCNGRRPLAAVATFSDDGVFADSSHCNISSYNWVYSLSKRSNRGYWVNCGIAVGAVTGHRPDRLNLGAKVLESFF